MKAADESCSAASSLWTGTTMSIRAVGRAGGAGSPRGRSGAPDPRVKVMVGSQSLGEVTARSIVSRRSRPYEPSKTDVGTHGRAGSLEPTRP